MPCSFSSQFDLRFPGAISTAFANYFVPREWLRENDTTPPTRDEARWARVSAAFPGFGDLSLVGMHSKIAGTAGVDGRASFNDFMGHIGSTSGFSAIVDPTSAANTVANLSYTIDTVNNQKRAAAVAAQQAAQAAAAAAQTRAAAAAAPASQAPTAAAVPQSVTPIQQTDANTPVIASSGGGGDVTPQNYYPGTTTGSGGGPPRAAFPPTSSAAPAPAPAPAKSPFSIIPLLITLAAFLSG